MRLLTKSYPPVWPDSNVIRFVLVATLVLSKMVLIYHGMSRAQENLRREGASL